MAAFGTRWALMCSHLFQVPTLEFGTAGARVQGQDVVLGHLKVGTGQSLCAQSFC